MRTPHHRCPLRTIARAVVVAGLGVACGLLCLCPVPVAAQAPPAPPAMINREYETKARILSELGKFVTWPEAVAPNQNRPLTIGVLGQDPFLEGGVNQLDRIVAVERAKGRAITIQRFDSAQDYRRCHILIVSDTPTAKSVERTLAERLAAAKTLTNGTPVLLVGQSSGLARQGCTANLLYDRATNLIRLELNPDAANRNGLELKPDLTRLRLVDLIRE